MKILLLGKNGQLGREFQRVLPALGSLVALDFQELDLQDFDAVRRTIRDIEPGIIVNASAYTAVDKAENEPEKVFAVNATLPGILADEANSLKGTLIHYSTDYVFDGTKGKPYTEEDIPNPLNVYGASKLAGEIAIQSAGGPHLVFRTSWVYSLGRDSFVTKVLAWSRAQEVLRVVNDQIGNPTWARLLADLSGRILERGPGYTRERSGLYHLAGGGFTSRFDWAKKVLELDPERSTQLVQELLPAPTSDFPTPAKRPLFSALDCSRFERTFELTLPPWQDILREAMTSPTSS